MTGFWSSIFGREEWPNRDKAADFPAPKPKKPEPHELYERNIAAWHRRKERVAAVKKIWHEACVSAADAIEKYRPIVDAFTYEAGRFIVVHGLDFDLQEDGLVVSDTKTSLIYSGAIRDVLAKGGSENYVHEPMLYSGAFGWSCLDETKYLDGPLCAVPSPGSVYVVTTARQYEVNCFPSQTEILHHAVFNAWRGSLLQNSCDVEGK